MDHRNERQTLVLRTRTIERGGSPSCASRDIVKDVNPGGDFQDLDREFTVARRAGLAVVTSAFREGFDISDAMDIATERKKSLGLHASTMRVFPVQEDSFSYDAPAFIVMVASPKVDRSALDVKGESFLRSGTLAGVLMRRVQGESWEARPFGDASWKDGASWQMLGANSEVAVPMKALLPSHKGDAAVHVKLCQLLLQAANKTIEQCSRQ
eukprot:TRINITY_DN307_c0_g1_i3.p1 TRINITY_DN307_c0_g1~~TRINITY_DN307_c0_g1_i3.p1  ORF type:complete len:211 (-),score=6.31 TRINITY_DN307_c0_g1_i3:257-889(-)